MERLLTTWHCLDQHGSKTSLAREKIAQKVMCDAHQHCIFFAVPPPTKKGNTREFARLCTFVHACNPPISKVPPGFPQLPVITESNLQFSCAPSTSKYGKLEFWQYSEISVRQFPPQEDNQAMSTPVHYSACDLVQLKSGKCQKLDLFKMIRCTILTFAQLNHLFRVMDFVRLDYFTTLPSNNSQNIMTGTKDEN